MKAVVLPRFSGMCFAEYGFRWSPRGGPSATFVPGVKAPLLLSCIGGTTVALPHTKTSGSARTAVVYITIGAIMDVWTALWYVYMSRHGTASDGPYFWCYGFFLTGVTLIVIGLALGRIGRAARHAEAPPDITQSNVVPPQPMMPPAAPQVPQSPVASVVPPR
jgi:hypothetical protein